MSKFKVLLFSGLALGVLAGGTIALFTSGKKEPASSAASTTDPARSSVGAPSVKVPVPTKATRAEALNNEGKNLMFAGKFEEASRRFQDALSLVQEPKYYFNLGTSLFQEGKFEEALLALDAVTNIDSTPERLRKTAILRRKILDECEAQGMTCHASQPVAKPSPQPAPEHAGSE